MAARFGDGIRPELGATDFSGFLQGSAQGSAAIGQGIAKLGAGAGQFLQDAAEKKKQIKGMEVEKKSTLQFLEATMGMIEDPKRKAQLGTVIDQVTMAPLQEAVAIGKNARAAIGFLGDEMNRQQTKTYQQGMLSAGERAQGFKEFESSRDFNRGKEVYSDSQAEVKRKADLEQEAALNARKDRAKEEWRAANPMTYDEFGVGIEPKMPAELGGAPETESVEGGSKDTSKKRGKIHYRTPNLEKLDMKAMDLLSEKRADFLDAASNVSELEDLYSDIAALPDFAGSQGLSKIAAGILSPITGGSSKDLESTKASANLVVQKMASIQQRYASLLAAARNDKVTDQDVQDAKAEIFDPAKSKEENLRNIVKMRDDILLAAKRVEEGDAYLKANGHLLGFRPGKVRMETPEPQTAVPEGRPYPGYFTIEGGSKPSWPQKSFDWAEAMKSIRADDKKGMLDAANKAEASGDFQGAEKIRKEADKLGQQGSTGPAGPVGPVSIGGFSTAAGRAALAKQGGASILMDSNSAKGVPVTSPLIVIPNGASKLQRKAARAYVEAVADLQKSQFGRKLKPRVVTRAANGRGRSNAFHTEGFAVTDKKMVEFLKTDKGKAAYQSILRDTLGKLPGARFHLPHSETDPGAVNDKLGVSEVSLARELMKGLDGSTQNY